MITTTIKCFNHYDAVSTLRDYGKRRGLTLTKVKTIYAAKISQDKYGKYLGYFVKSKRKDMKSIEAHKVWEAKKKWLWG